MLKEALLVAHEHSEADRKYAEYVLELQKLPMDELKKVATTGEIKLAFLGMPCEPGGPTASWLDHFKGTPFFEQAIALEQEELQAQMAQQQASSVERAKNQQQWDQMDQIRLKKRLLELQKARNEAQVLSGGGGPPTQTGSGAEAQGAGALGPVAPEGQQEGSGDTNKMAAKMKLAKLEMRQPQTDAELEQLLSPEEKERLKTAGKYPALKGIAGGAALGGGVFGALGALNPKKAKPESEHFSERHPKINSALRSGVAGAILSAGMTAGHIADRVPGELTREARHLTSHLKTKGKAALTHVKDTAKAHLMSKTKKDEANAVADEALKKMTKKSSVDAELVGRAMARQDMAKVARAKEVLTTGDVTGRALAKTGGVLGQVGKWALEHPGQAGAVAGGTLGAAHGLLREGGGVGEAVAEGAAGAGLGHAAGSIAGGTRSLQGTMGEKIVGSAKMYGGHVKNEAIRLSDKLKNSLSEAKPPEASLGGPQVQKND